MTKARISQQLRAKVRLDSRRQYRLAQMIEVDPSLLSAWVNDIVLPRAGDARVVALGRIVGVPPDHCFEPARPPLPTRTSS